MLSDKAVKKAKPADKKYSAYDTGGLSLIVTPAESKYWVNHPCFSSDFLSSVNSAFKALAAIADY